MIHLGCAGWSLSRTQAEHFSTQGSHLERYASTLDAVEINSSFYRPHRPATYARWAASVPETFRFSVKVPKHITHEQRLVDCEPALITFLDQCGELGERLGCLLVQLPPSLVYEPELVKRFLGQLRNHFTGHVAIEPRHRTWIAAEPLLIDMQIAQVAADPSRYGADAAPRGWPGLVYWRLHGSPKVYYSDYPSDWLQKLAPELMASASAGRPTWCIFDNTAADAAVGDALEMQALVR
ncbi:DUF72 domain-containing protein [Pseudomonas capeferrum]|uniref:DUF72 domain-containing protein n=1 Tax=Pseudomonas capeferrum TaxID=1495066 RepID=UPI0015E31A81|nr:DUF72 domain-containing protein [Pseudomonas capeferrum]MBA1203194.1 DUF72 domain-containing protein [Pseudomonas capeferrum]